jgi:hypothetical protein
VAVIVRVRRLDLFDSCRAAPRNAGPSRHFEDARPFGRSLSIRLVLTNSRGNHWQEKHPRRIRGTPPWGCLFTLDSRHRHLFVAYDRAKRVPEHEFTSFLVRRPPDVTRGSEPARCVGSANAAIGKRLRTFATFVGCAVAAYVVARLFAHTDASAMWRAIGSGGPLVVLAPVPFALGVTLDACGSVLLLRALGSRTTLAQMLPVRIASEALHISVPAGFVASDTATAVLLDARSDVPVRDGVVLSIARKWLVMRAHALYIVVGALVGFHALAGLSRERLGGALPWIVIVSAVIPLGASWVLGASLLGRSTFARMHAALARVPCKGLGIWLDARRTEAVATDAQLKRLRAARRATLSATCAFLGCWCLEALESALLLRLVGADIALGSIIAVEAGLSLVRSMVVFAPAGLGVVDFGYATVLPALGGDPGSVAAFVLLKRSKELGWVVLGYAILGTLRGASRHARLLAGRYAAREEA